MQWENNMDTDDRLRGRACIWCGKKLLYFDNNIDPIGIQVSCRDCGNMQFNPIGIRVSCRDCGAKGPIGVSKKEALQLYLYGPSAAIQKQNKKSIINAILIGAE